MMLEDTTGSVDMRRVALDLAERTIDDLHMPDDDGEHTPAFDAAARDPDTRVQAHILRVRPAVTAIATATTAEIGRGMRPDRLTLARTCPRNPPFAAVKETAAKGRAVRQPIGPDGPFPTAGAPKVQKTELTSDVIGDPHDMIREPTVDAMRGSRSEKALAAAGFVGEACADASGSVD